MLKEPEVHNRSKLYRKILLIRKFEERLLELFKEGVLFGTTHTCIGQEASAVSVIEHLKDGDLVVSNHRCHGHYLARTNDSVGLLSEIMGKKEGPCQGRGGSQHLCKNGFYSNGVQGNIFPVAAGMAHAEKLKRSGNIVVVFIGDGTFGEGVLYETLNLVSLWNVPLLTVVENNRYAQSTSIKNNFAGNFSSRISGFNISFGEVESNDVEELSSRFFDIIEGMRMREKPHVEVIHTYRLGPHSTTEYGRSLAEVEDWKKRDPLKILEHRLMKSEVNEIRQLVKNELQNAEKKVKQF